MFGHAAGTTVGDSGLTHLQLHAILAHRPIFKLIEVRVTSVGAQLSRTDRIFHAVQQLPRLHILAAFGPESGVTLALARTLKLVQRVREDVIVP